MNKQIKNEWIKKNTEQFNCLWLIHQPLTHTISNQRKLCSHNVPLSSEQLWVINAQILFWTTESTGPMKLVSSSVPIFTTWHSCEVHISIFKVNMMFAQLTGVTHFHGIFNIWLKLPSSQDAYTLFTNPQLLLAHTSGYTRDRGAGLKFQVDILLLNQWH